MNIADLRIAIFNHILSKQLNDKLLIRIDDTQKDKNIEGKEKQILEILSLFSIEYERVIYGSESLKYHQKLAMQLMSQKKAFACFCSEEKLNELKYKAKEKGKVYSYDGFCSTLSDETVLNCNAAFTVRIQKPDISIGFNDIVKGICEYKPYELDSFFILNHDKTPTNNFASALDDMLFDISTILSDEKDLLDNSRQIHIRNLLNYTKDINYMHIPTVSNYEDYSVRTLIDKGFLPSAIANYLVLLGNNRKEEFFSIEEAIEWFDIKNISKDEVFFDIEKLKELNKKHLKNIDELRLSKILGFADADIGKLAKLYLDELSTINEIKEKINSIFNRNENKQNFNENEKLLNDCIKKAPFFEKYEDFEKYLLKNSNLNKQECKNILKFILIGQQSGPDISEVYTLIKNYLGEIVK